MRPMRPQYLDPATGSYVIQMIVAGAIGAFYTIYGFFQSEPVSEESEAAAPTEEGEKSEEAERPGAIHPSVAPPSHLEDSSK